MARYYRGAGVGTYWHSRDARASGFVAAAPGTTAGPLLMIDHVVNQITLSSPYVSMTRSYEVAEHYAKYFGLAAPTANAPAYVYEIIFDPLPSGVQLYDPIQELAKSLTSPLATPPFYQHNGAPDVLLGLVDRVRFGFVLTRPVRNPGSPTGVGPHISDHLNALVRALRDAEVLAYASIPQSCVRMRHSIS